jgi:hypothetical protein
MSRQVPPLETHTFKDTGWTVQIRKLSPFLKDDIESGLRSMDRKSEKMPKPPMVPGVEGKLEPNESDPDYMTALGRYNFELRGRVNEALLRAAIRRGIVLDTIGEDIVAEEIARFKTELEADGIISPDEDPKYFFVTRICIGSDEDTREMYDALFKRSQPSREEIEDQKAMFRGDVPGSTD